MGIALTVLGVLLTPYLYFEYKYYLHKKATKLGSRQWGYATFEDFKVKHKQLGDRYIVWGDKAHVLKVDGKGMVMSRLDYIKLLKYFKNSGRTNGYHKDLWK